MKFAPDRHIGTPAEEIFSEAVQSAVIDRQVFQGEFINGRSIPGGCSEVLDEGRAESEWVETPTGAADGPEAWMTGYQAGDANSAGRLIETVHPLLHRYFLGMVGNRAEAEDLLQETWLRVHRVRHTYRKGEPLLPWIFAIARRVRIDGYRRTSRLQARELAGEAFHEGVMAVAPGSTSRLELDSLLRHLPEAQREILTLMRASDLNLDEVARTTGLSSAAVKQKAYRAYRKLREMFGAAGPWPEERSEADAV